VERRPIEALVPYARNARTHSPEQVAQIAASLREWGWTMPVLVDDEGTILAGHGRILAARQLGFPDIPVVVARGWSDAKRRAYIIADNKLAENAGWDCRLLVDWMLAGRGIRARAHSAPPGAARGAARVALMRQGYRARYCRA
jgi:ParB-like chromosome segregation protein Spo0J